MNYFQLISSVLLCGFLYWFLQTSDRKKRKLPPGPFQWPLLGNIVNLVWEDPSYVYVAMTKLAKKYGSLVSYKLGTVDILVVSGFEACKEAYNNDDLLDRVDHKLLLDRSFGKKIGIIFPKRRLWKVSQKYTITHFRDFGYGNTKKNQLMDINEFVAQEFEEIVMTINASIKDSNGELEPERIFKITALNVIWTLLSGKRFRLDDPIGVKLGEHIGKLSKVLQFGGGISSAYPFLVDWFPSFFGSELRLVNKNMQVLFQDIMDEHRQRGTYKTNPESFIDSFLQKMEQNHTNELDKIFFTDENFIALLYDYFWAGSDTVSETLSYAVLYLTLYPDVQKKLRETVRSFIAENGPPAAKDFDRMIYAKATVFELFRRTAIVPVSPRKVYKDVVFRDYLIPKHTEVLLNLYSVHMDEETWRDPSNFKPERFISPDGTSIVNSERLLTFGVGKRSCVGDSIARSSIFLLVVQLVDKYEFLPVPGHTYDVSPITGIIVAPQKYSVKVQHAQ